MVSKRIRFALLTCVFALYGCAVGEKPTEAKDMMEAAPFAVAMETGFLYESTEEMIAREAALGNLSADADKAFVAQVRHADGELRSVSAIKAYGERAQKQISKDIEEAKQQKKAKAKREEDAKKQQVEQASASFGNIASLKTTTYGVDCYGCAYNNGQGSTANGVKLDIHKGVLLPDGTWQPGIRYGKYYIVAADPDIPLCSVLRISDHGLSGSGISPQEPFEAIVLDRGGAIYGNHIDLYIGSENSNAIRQVQSANPSAEIIRLGGMQNGSCPL